MAATKQYTVFYAAGSRTFKATKYNIDWKSNEAGWQGILRLYDDEQIIAVFPPGGWLGIYLEENDPNSDVVFEKNAALMGFPKMQTQQGHPDYDSCSCKDTWEHRDAVRAEEGVQA